MAKSGVDTFEVTTAFAHSDQRKKVNIRSLKMFAFQKFARNCALRDILLAERDLQNVNEFLTKMEIWLKLSQRIEDTRAKLR